MWRFIKGLLGMGESVAMTASVRAWLYGAAAAACVALLGATFAAGWTVNGWRLERAAEEARALRAEDSLAKAGQMLADYTALMARLGDLAKAGIDREAAIRKAALEGQNAIKTWLAAHDGCRVTDDDVRLLRDNAGRRDAAGAAAPH